MNKRLFLILLVASALVHVTANAEVVQENAKTPEDNESVREGVHPHYDVTKLTETYAHWSLQIEGGLNLIDADFKQSSSSLAPFSRIRPMGGISLQCDFTPVWGLSLGYQYANFGVKSTTNGLSNWLLYGHMHTIGLDLSFDLIDCWFPHRKHNICSLYLLAGGGLGIYSSEYRIVGDETNAYRHPEDGSYAVTGVISAGALLEFNLSRSLAMGIKGQYKWYTSDKIDGKVQGSSNDAAEYCSIAFRYKFGAQKNNHTRNYPSNEKMMEDLLNQNPQKKQAGLKDTIVISNKDTLVISNVDTIYLVQRIANGENGSEQYVAGKEMRDNYERTQARMRDIELKISRLENQINNGASPAKTQDLERKIAQLEKQIANLQESGIKQGMVSEPSWQSRTIGGLINIGEDVAVYDHVGYVFFDNDRYTLNEHAQQDVLKIADKLLDNSMLYAEVVGFCDNSGSETYNQELAKKRANTVINELVNIYKISPERILPMGIGKLHNVPSSYAPNRRVEVHFTTKKNLEAMRNEVVREGERVASYKSQPATTKQSTTAKPAATTTKPTTTTTAKTTASTTTKPASTIATTAKPATSSVSTTNATREGWVKPGNVIAAEKETEQAREITTSKADVKNETPSTTVRPMTKDEIARVVVKQGYTTLVRLARRFYNCADCWVYIYEANKSVISDPDVLTDNMMIIIPKVSEAQKDSTVLKEKLRQYGK